MPILNWKELQQRNNQRQAGITEDVPDAEWLQGWDRTAPDAQEQYAKRFHDTFLRNKSADETVADMATAYREYRDAPSPYTDEDAARMGYGESRYDTRIPFDQWVKNPTDYRANSQTVVNKLLSGLGKMGVYAGATFVDNIGGTLNGVFDVFKDAVNGDGFTPVQSFINNPVSKAMRRAQEWSDEAMPNYRTEEETMDADHWWRHLNANFWGDTFLKNIGFTLGAAGAGKIFSVATQGAQMHRLKRMYGDAVYDAYKAAVAASAGDAAAQGAFREMLQGTPMDAKTMYDTFSKLNRSYNRMQWNGILAGSIGGAVGESRMEAMFNAKEFRDETLPKAEARYEQAKLDLQEELLNNERYLMDEPVYDGYGNQVGTRPILNPEGEAYYRERLKELQASYQKELGLIDDEAASLANWTFGLNMPILTGGNIVMFGRNFAGGFRSQARARVRGNMTQGYRPKGSPWNQAVRGMATAVSEGTEELAQKVVSEGTKNKARRDMAAYYNGKYDKQALKDTSQWLMSVLNSVSDVIADPQSWEEFVVGFLTGGGTSLINAVARKDQRRELEQSKEYAESLNKILADPDFKTRWEHFVRHMHYDYLKENALDN
ncbi:MAG: hypothetical protein II661_00225, partial [Bacteroidales bacterium]|nr:hypothetical protein [Bacteroidales bacterium]